MPLVKNNAPKALLARWTNNLEIQRKELEETIPQLEAQMKQIQHEFKNKR